MISGLDSVRDRAEEAEKIANWAFRQFTQKTLLEGNKRVADADVWLGKKPTVGLIAKDDIIGLIPYTTTEEVSMTVVYDGPLEAPIAAGDDVAKLRVDVPGMEPVFYPLYAETDVGPGGVFTRFKGSAQVLARRALVTAFGAEQ